jgi:hypothetical protein
MEVSQNGWFVIDNPIKLDDLEVPPFQEIPNYIYIYFNIYIYHVKSHHDNNGVNGNFQYIYIGICF